MKKPFYNALIISATVLVTGVLSDMTFKTGLIVADAEARIGRPLTPISYAGVARRVTRRTIYRTSVYAATLPRSCQTVIVEGTQLYLCGSTYYQTAGSQYVVVNVQ